MAAAIAFFKALKVYPAPHELIMIYQKTQPQAVFELVMELVTLESVRTTLSALPCIPNPPLHSVSTSRAPPTGASISAVDPRDDHSDALLEEVTPVPAPAPAAATEEQTISPAPTPVAPASDNGSSPSAGGSFVHVQDEVEGVLDAAADKVEEVAEKAGEVAEDVKEMVEEKIEA